MGDGVEVDVEVAAGDELADRGLVALWCASRGVNSRK
jgi:hypothetical protein